MQENWETKGSEVVFTVKNYKSTNGLSSRLHKLNQNDLYQVKGLMGKGLCIKPHGAHVAFVAGTGVLVFVDLIAFMIR